MIVNSPEYIDYQKQGELEYGFNNPKMLFVNEPTPPIIEGVLIGQLTYTANCYGDCYGDCWCRLRENNYSARLSRQDRRILARACGVVDQKKILQDIYCQWY